MQGGPCNINFSNGDMEINFKKFFVHFSGVNDFSKCGLEINYGQKKSCNQGEKLNRGYEFPQKYCLYSLSQVFCDMHSHTVPTIFEDSEGTFFHKIW